MYILFMIWFLLLLIMQIIYLVKSAKTKHNKNWSVLFAIISSSILSTILLWVYSLFNVANVGWNIILVFIICVVAIIIYAIMLLISIILKVLEVKKHKKLNIIREKMEKKTLQKVIVIPILMITLISICMCVIDYSKYVIHEKIETKRYNETKQTKIEEMANFINKKYNLNFDIEDCIYYREEDYSSHTGIFGNVKTYNIPYITVFEKENQKITVADRKGVISDNAQLKDLNYYIGDYFSKIVDTDIDFVQISKTYNGNIEDYTINSILQNGFNEKITQNNISDFMDKIFKEDDLELLFYVKDTEDRIGLINTLTSKLSYLKKYNNIERIMIYIYDKNEKLLVNNIEKELDEEYKQYNTSDDYYDDYKFGYYYVPNDFEYYYPDSENSNFKNEEFNTFVASAYYNLNRGYGSGQGNKIYEIINDWYVYTY